MACSAFVDSVPGGRHQHVGDSVCSGWRGRWNKHPAERSRCSLRVLGARAALCVSRRRARPAAADIIGIAIMQPFTNPNNSTVNESATGGVACVVLLLLLSLLLPVTPSHKLTAEVRSSLRCALLVPSPKHHRRRRRHETQSRLSARGAPPSLPPPPERFTLGDKTSFASPYLTRNIGGAELCVVSGTLLPWRRTGGDAVEEADFIMLKKNGHGREGEAAKNARAG